MPAAHLTVWGEAECRRLHKATLELLEQIGVEVMYEPALDLFAAAGADVQARRVRIPGRLVDAALASAPTEWPVKPRGGDTEPLVLRDGEVYFGTGSDCLVRARSRHGRATPRPAGRYRGRWRHSARSCRTSTSS